MTQFLALLKLQLLTRYADLKPKNLKNAMKEKRGRTVGMMIAFIFLFIYFGVFLYIIETKALDFLYLAPEGAPNPVDMRDLLVLLAVFLSTAGTLIMAFFFIMSSLYLGRDSVFLASLPIKPRKLLGAKLAQVWLSETRFVAATTTPRTSFNGSVQGRRRARTPPA